jgi:hypothetical protein
MLDGTERDTDTDTSDQELQPPDALQPPEPLENGKPRRWAEFGFAASGVIFIGLMMIPYELKKGQAWNTAANSLLLGSVILSVACLFWGNTHIKMIRFLSGKKIFAQVVILALMAWLQVMIIPDVGWGVTHRIAATTTLTFRLAFICLDSLKGISRLARLFIAFFFMFGNFLSVFLAYFMDSARTIFIIQATNTTITTSDVQASVGTAIVTLTASMIVTIWQDKDFQYSALYRSYLPKLAVETAGVKHGSAEMDLILAERDEATAAWRGWPKVSAVVVLLSVLVFTVSVVLSNNEPEYDVDGRESTLMLALRGAALFLGGSGSCVFLSKSVNRRRLHYTFTSTRGVLWMFYTLIFALAGFARPKGTAHALGTVYTTLGFTPWLSPESVQQISRFMHFAITVTIAFTLATAIYLSAYVWQNDAVLADLNGVGLAGVLTRYALQRTCYINLSLLMAGSLVTMLKKNLSDNWYFMLVEGNVLRGEILEAESLTFDPDGGYDFIAYNSLERLHRRRVLSHAQRALTQRLSLHRHRRSVLSGDSAVRGRQSVETTSNDGAIGSGVEMASNGLVSI